MSGSFEELDVPPTLVSFAVKAGKADWAVSTEFKSPGSRVALMGADPFDAEATLALWEEIEALMRAGKVRAAWAVGAGGIAEGLAKMCFGNRLGVSIDAGFDAGPALRLEFRQLYPRTRARLRGRRDPGRGHRGLYLRGRRGERGHGRRGEGLGDEARGRLPASEHGGRGPPRRWSLSASRRQGA